MSVLGVPCVVRQPEGQRLGVRRPVNSGFTCPRIPATWPQLRPRAELWAWPHLHRFLSHTNHRGCRLPFSAGTGDTGWDSYALWAPDSTCQVLRQPDTPLAAVGVVIALHAGVAV